MRRLVIAALAAGLVAASATGAGAAPKAPKAPPAVPATLLLFGVGSFSVDVTVPRGVSLVLNNPLAGRAPGFAYVDTESWGAVAIVSKTTKVAGKPVNAVHVRTPAPDHCPSETAPTTTPVPKCEKYVEQVSVHGLTGTKMNTLFTHFALPAGTYQVVVAAPPGKFSAAAIPFAGRSGTHVMRGTKRVTASFERARNANLVFAQTTGSFGGKLPARGIGVLGVWHTTAGDEPGEFTYAQCVTPGSAGPLNPDDCTAVGVSGQAPPDALGRKPVFWQSSTGGVTLDNAGQGTFQTPVLAPGTYVNSYRVTRGGRGPAAGAFVLWLSGVFG